MLTQYNLKMPHAVYGGENAMDNITAIIKARGAKKVAMFTDKGIEGAGLFALPEEAVKLRRRVLCAGRAAPGAQLHGCAEAGGRVQGLRCRPHRGLRRRLCDGRCQAGKRAGDRRYGVKELLDNPGMAQKCVPIVLIPTTAGTAPRSPPTPSWLCPKRS